jgi:hypothetical protein
MKRMVFFCALACGRLNGDDTTGGGPVTLDEVPARGAHAICTQMFACCDLNERQMLVGGLDPGAVTSESECEAAYSNALAMFIVPEFNMSIGSGSALYDANMAGACLAELETESCTAFGSAFGANADKTGFGCGLVDPLVQLSGSCMQSYECTTGNCENGICQPIPTAGEVCTSVCEPGLFCGFDPMSGQETCQALKPDFDSCGSDGECQSTHCIGSGSGGSGSGSCEAGPPLCDGV